jgi:hypothetical protein
MNYWSRITIPEAEEVKEALAEPQSDLTRLEADHSRPIPERAIDCCWLAWATQDFHHPGDPLLDAEARALADKGRAECKEDWFEIGRDLVTAFGVA